MDRVQNYSNIRSSRWLKFNLKIEAKLNSPETWRITKIALRALLFLSRCLNFAFGDHSWHSQANVVRKIDLYRGSLKAYPSIRDHEAEILELVKDAHNSSETREELLDSLINTEVPRIAAMPQERRTLFQVVANEFGANSKFEGCHQSATIGLLLQFCEALAPESLKKIYGIEASLLNELRQTVFLKKEAIAETRHLIDSAISTGQPVLIAGGWIGKPSGHAMMYEVVPSDDDEMVNFRIYNLGAGASWHQLHVENGKLKCVPGVEWVGVRKDKLLNDIALTALVEMKCELKVPDQNNDTEFNERDIYGGLYKYLKPSASRMLESNVPYKTLQHSGICTWRSIEAFLATRLTEHQYKRLILDIKLSCVLELTNSTTRRSQKQWTLVNKAAIKLARKVDTAFAKGYVTEEYLLQAYALLNQVNQWVEQHPFTEEPKLCVVGQEEKKVIQTIPMQIRAKIPPLEQQYEGGTSLAVKPPTPAIFHLFERLYLVDPASAVSHLKRAADFAQRLWEGGGEDDALNIALCHFIKKIPFTREFWNDAVGAANGLKDLVEPLRRLGKIAFKSSFMIANAAQVHPELVFCQTKLKNIFQLLGIIEGPQNKEFCLNVHNHLDKIGAFCRVTGKEYELKLDHLYPIVGPQYASQHLFTVLNGNTLLTLNIPNDSGHSNNLHKFFTKHAPHIHAEIERVLNETINYSNLTNYQKHIHLLTSEVLPDWMLGCRDAALAEAWLTYKPVSRLTGLNRVADLEFEFADTQGTNEAPVQVSLSGVAEQTFIDNPDVQTVAAGLFDRKPAFSQQHYKFELWFKKLSSPVLKKFFLAMTNEQRGGSWHEKKILSLGNTDDTGVLTDEDFYELATLFSDSTTRPWKVMAYFSKYPSKLNDTDYQTLFKFLLLDRLTIKNIVEDDIVKFYVPVETGFYKALFQFIDERFTTSFHQGEVATCVILNQIAGIFETYYPDSPFFNATFERYVALLHKPTLSAEDELLIYMGLIEYVYKKDRPSDEELEFCLKGLLQTGFCEQICSDMDPEMNRCRHAFTIKFARRIDQFFVLPHGLNEERVQRVLSKYVPQPQGWTFNRLGAGYEIVNHDQTVRYAPLNSTLRGVSKRVPIPYRMRQQVEFKNLFPNVYECEGINNEVCKIVTPNGDENYACLVEDWLYVDQKRAIDGAWSRYLNPRELLDCVIYDDKTAGSHSKFQGKAIVFAYQSWIDRASPSIVRFKHRLDPTAEFASFILDLETMQIRNPSLGRVLLAPSDRLTRVELSKHIYEWYSIAETSVRGYPAIPESIGLYFSRIKFKKVQGDPPRFESGNFPGHYLIENGRIPALGRYKEYLVLEDRRGAKKLILPYYPLKILNETQEETLLPNYQLDFEHQAEYESAFKYQLYSIDEEGVPFGDTLESNLWLAVAFSLAQKYRYAAKILRGQGDCVVPYTAPELKFLKLIAHIAVYNGDKSGEAQGISFFARYLLARNKSIHEELTSEELEALHLAYLEYLNHAKNVMELPLTEFEEQYLCKWLLGLSPLKTENAIMPLRTRLQTLLTKNLTSASIGSFPDLVSGNTDQKAAVAWTSEQQLVTSAQAPYLVTRGGYHIEKHFVYYYELAATGGGPEKEKLLAACQFLKVQSEYKLLGEFLLLIDRHPDLYVPPANKLVEGWQVAKKRAEMLVKQHREAQPASVSEAVLIQHGPIASAHPQETPPFTFSVEQNDGMETGRERFFKVLPNGSDSDEGDFTRWMQRLMGEQRELTALEAREYTRLITSCGELEDEPLYEITDSDLNLLEASLKEGQEQNQARLSELKRAIMKQARVKPAAPVEAALAKLKVLGGKKKISFHEILISFARQNPAPLLEKNSALTEASLHQMYSDVAECLVLATQEQQRERALKEIRKTRKATGDMRIALHQTLRKIVCARREYEIKDYPGLLVFEYYAEKLLWDKQVRGLKLFLENKGENPVMELIMGSGKSEVLLPLLALLRADGTSISMLVAPQTLFENVSSNTQKIIREAFGQSLHTLFFDRNTKLTSTRLELMLEELQHVRDNKEAIVVTSKTIQCLILKFMEEAYKHYHVNRGEPEVPQRLVLLGDILRLLSTSGYPVVDEADSVMKIMHETSFNLGHLLKPHQHEVAFIRAVYAFALGYPELKIEAKEGGDSAASVLTHTLYEERWKRVLVEEAIRWFKLAQYGDFGLEDHEINGLRALPETMLRGYLNRNAETKADLDAWFQQIPELRVRDLVALAAEEFSHLFSFTLLKEWNVAYGLDHQQRTPLPVPFEYAAVPKRGSVFANSYITKNYAFQSYLKEGVSADQIMHHVKRLQDQAETDMKKSGVMDCTKTSAWNEFCVLKGGLDIPLFGIKDQHLRMMTERINESKENILEYVSQLVLPQLSLFSHKITCSPINMISIFRWASGCTGTLYNDKSMYHLLTPFPESGTEAKTLKILWKHSSRDEDVIIVKNESSEKLLIELKNIPHDALIDGGGYLKEMSNAQVAATMTELFSMPTVHYNSKGEKVVIEDKEEKPLKLSKLKLDQRRTYYDHSHAIGANILQKLDAVAFVTVGKNITLRDMLQFVWRMRGLAGLQRIKFIVSQEVASIIRHDLGLTEDTKISFVYILAFAIKNQAKQQGVDNHKSFEGQLRNISQQLLLKTLFDTGLSEQQKQLAFRHLQANWIQSVTSSAAECFGVIPVEIDAAVDVAMRLEQAKTAIREIYYVCPFLNAVRSERDCLEEIEKIHSQIRDKTPGPVASSSSAAEEKASYYLPPKVSSPDQPGDETVDIELDLELDTERDLEIVQDNRRNGKMTLGSMGRAKYRLCRFDEVEDAMIQSEEGVPVVELDSILGSIPELQPFAGLFEGISFSINMCQWDKQLGFKESFELFGVQRTPLREVISSADDFMVVGELDVNLSPPNTHRYHVDFVYQDPHRHLSEREQVQLTKMRFFFGEISYTKAERGILKAWAKEVGVGLLKALFEKHILMGFPGKSERYRSSWLRKLLDGKR